MYTTIEQELYNRAKFYLDKANEYLYNKQYGHASGCLAKAAKKITQAQHIKLLSNDEGIEKILRTMIDALSKNFAKNIMRGNNESDKIED